jgi:hypothetical protein
MQCLAGWPAGWLMLVSTPLQHQSLLLDTAAPTLHARRSMLQQWSGLQEEQARLQGHYSAVVLDMQGAYEGRAARASQVRSAYRQLVAEVAASSEHSHSGRPLSMKDVGELQHQEEEVGSCCLLWPASELSP